MQKIIPWIISIAIILLLVTGPQNAFTLILFFLGMCYFAYRKVTGQDRYTFRGTLYFWLAFIGSIFMIFDAIF